MNKKLFEIICAKEDNKAREAAKMLINNCDLNEFRLLCEKMDYLFDFVRENVYNRLTFAVNKENFMNLIKFYDYYSQYFDDFFAELLSKYANEELTDEIFDILSNGSDSQKAYAACYFKKIPDTVAIDELKKNLNTDFEPLFENCASALGKMNDIDSYKKHLCLLNSDDDFIKLKAVKFLISYGDKKAVNEIINAMNKSAMSENIAGEVTALISPLELLEKNYNNGVLLINNLINGLGEILPLENIFNYEIYEITNYFINNPKTSQAPIILFNLKNKFEILTQNEEYIFDLDKETKNEIFEIKKLILSSKDDFWNNEKILLDSCLKADNPLLSTVFEIIKNNKFKEFLPKLIRLAKSEEEIISYEAVCAIKELGAINDIDKTKINFTNPNLKASFEQMFL